MPRRRRWTRSIRTSAAGQPWLAAEALGQHSAALDRCEASGCWPSPRAKSTGGDRSTSGAGGPFVIRPHASKPRPPARAPAVIWKR